MNEGWSNFPDTCVPEGRMPLGNWDKGVPPFGSMQPHVRGHGLASTAGWISAARYPGAVHNLPHCRRPVVTGEAIYEMMQKEGFKPSKS